MIKLIKKKQKLSKKKKKKLSIERRKKNEGWNTYIK